MERARRIANETGTGKELVAEMIHKVGRREGRFELAKGGTLFLDEVSEIPMATQIKLLRFLQEGTFERVGGNETLKVDVRMIAASNRDLKQRIAEALFRKDEYSVGSPLGPTQALLNEEGS